MTNFASWFFDSGWSVLPSWDRGRRLFAAEAEDGAKR
jgi:hypothetical protein